MEYLIPENEQIPILPLNTGVCTMKITRSFYVNIKNEKLFFKHKINNLSDQNKDYFELNNSKYYVNAISDIIQKYVVVSACITIKPQSQNKNGYIWCSYNDQDSYNTNNLKNNWTCSMNKFKDGMRTVYVPDNYEIQEINQTNSKDYIYIFTEHEIDTELEIKIIKNINYIPFDQELFVPKVNYEQTLQEIKDKIKENM